MLVCQPSNQTNGADLQLLRSSRRSVGKLLLLGGSMPGDGVRARLRAGDRWDLYLRGVSTDGHFPSSSILISGYMYSCCYPTASSFTGPFRSSPSSCVTDERVRDPAQGLVPLQSSDT